MHVSSRLEASVRLACRELIYHSKILLRDFTTKSKIPIDHRHYYYYYYYYHHHHHFYYHFYHHCYYLPMGKKINLHLCLTYS